MNTGWTIVKRENGMWHIRAYVPKSLQGAIGKREITRSLRTGGFQEARRLAPAIHGKIQREIIQMLGGEPVVPEVTIPGRFVELNGPVVAAQVIASRITLKQLVDEYNANKSSGWAPKSAPSFYAKQRELLSFFGEERDIKSITDSECIQLRDGLYTLPRSFRNFADWRAQPLRAIFKHFAPSPAESHLSANTVNTYLDHLSSILGWAHQKGWLVRNPLKTVDKLKKKDQEPRRRPATDEELGALFAYKDLEIGKNAENNFWVVAIAYATGMRLAEVAQLGTSDIQEYEGFFAFHVRATTLDGIPRRLKTQASVRAIPIHPELVRLGVLEFLQKPRPGSFVFPDAKSESGAGIISFSNVYSKRMNRIFRNAGVSDRTVVFHSLRHSFRKATKDAEFPVEAAKQIGGWTTGTDMAEHYGGKFTLRQLDGFMRRVQLNALAVLKPRVFGK